MSATILGTAGAAALTFILTAAKSLMGSQSADSLINVAGNARVEPITMVDQRLMATPYLSDVLQSLVSQFSAYYLQAVSLHMNVGSVNTIQLLDQLNPNRSNHQLLKLTTTATPGLASIQTNPDAYTFGLPRRNQAVGLEAYGLTPYETKCALEDIKNEFDKRDWKVGGSGGGVEFEYDSDGNSRWGDAKKNDGAHSVQFGKTAVQDIMQSAPLSVGKMLEVTLTDGSGDQAKKLTIPVSVRLLTTPVDSSVMAHILSDGGRNITWKERWNAFKASELEFWRDLVFASDLIDEHRQVLLKDKTGAYREILARRRGNAYKAVLSATPSLATASNLMVISTATAREVERKLMGKFNDVQMRNKVFKMSYLMILAIVDPDNETITFYHRGIALGSMMSVRDLKVSNKSNGGSGPDIGDLLQKLLSGKPASF